MNYGITTASILALAWTLGASAAISEKEPNNDTGSALPLPGTDETVGQLKAATDEDWYFVDVADPQQSITPVYFGCNKRYDDYFVGECDPPVPESSWQVNYYYGSELQSSYVFNKNVCKEGQADLKGPVRFQMNTATPGRYYVQVRGVAKQCSVQGKPSSVIVANTADYSLRVATGKTRGEAEPNDGRVEATPIPGDAAVIGQLSSMSDQDWYVVDYSGAGGPSGNLPVYFNCAGSQAGAYFLVAWFDPSGVLQSSYEITQPECSVSGGYRFKMTTPVSGKYYVVVGPPTYPSGSVGVAGPKPGDTLSPASQIDYATSTQFSSHDYMLSTFAAVADTPASAQPGAVQGAIVKASVADDIGPNRDGFTVKMLKCGSNKGQISVNGKNLNLAGVDKNLRLKLELDGWACESDPVAAALDESKPTRKIYQYPEPKPVKAPAPTVSTPPKHCTAIQKLSDPACQ